MGADTCQTEKVSTFPESLLFGFHDDAGACPKIDRPPSTLQSVAVAGLAVTLRSFLMAVSLS